MMKRVIKKGRHKGILKGINKGILGLTGLLVLGMILTTSVSKVRAAEKEVALTVSCQYDDLNISGAEVKLYQIASLTEDMQLVLREEYKSFADAMESTTSDEVRTLETYVMEKQVEPLRTGKTNSEGKIHFDSNEETLEQGVYLVVTNPVEESGTTYSTMLVLVYLPYYDTLEEAWIYDVDLETKWEKQTTTRSVPETSQPATETPQTPKTNIPSLPYTGQVWWPIPVLFACGIFALIWAIYETVKGKKTE